jgi:hypothetical protein
LGWNQLPQGSSTLSLSSYARTEINCRLKTQGSPA